MFEDYEWTSKVVRERIAKEREQGLEQGLAVGRAEAMRDSVIELARQGPGTRRRGGGEDSRDR